jgi:NhaP-type Na+/H+ and K+/H+ antiporter
MALMFTFVLFGVSVIWQGLGIIGTSTILFVGAVFAARPMAFLPALLPARLSWANRSLIAWFGPRALSSLLLVLLPVFAGLPYSDRLLTICCLVVLFSVLLHGISPIFLIRTASPKKQNKQPDEIAAIRELAVSAPELSNPEYISIDEVKALQAHPGQVIVIDARTERTYSNSDQFIPGAIRLPSEQFVKTAAELGIPKGTVLAVFCT